MPKRTVRSRGEARSRKAAAPSARGAKRRPRAKPARRPMAQRRADYGAPVEGFFAKQGPPIREILDTLRALVEEAAPDATASLKWGMPFYTVGGETLCALAAFKAHVNLILPGAPGTYADPGGLLEGEGKTGKHLKLAAGAAVPREAVRGWLRTSAQLARERAAR
jgi:hypothetical protein